MSEKLVTKDAMFKAEDASFMKLGQVLGPCQQASCGGALRRSSGDYSTTTK